MPTRVGESLVRPGLFDNCVEPVRDETEKSPQ